MQDYIIELKDVSYSYYRNNIENKVLEGIDISVRKGEFVAVLGRNGSGKSTLAKLINGILLPDSGEVRVDGMDTGNESLIWNIRETAGIVFQNPDNQLVATMVEEDVAFGPENQGIPSSEIRARVEEALSTVDMLDYRRHAPHLLSGGQKQRVAIAGILAMKPKCIVFDEPTAMLDPSGRKEVMDTIYKLREEGKTIVHITHYMEETIKADRIIVIDSGKIVVDGSPREVFQDIDFIKALGLDVPQMTQLAYSLKKDGFDIETDILTIDELVEKI